MMQATTMYLAHFSHTQSDVLTEVMSVIAYVNPCINPPVEGTILTAVYDLRTALHIFLYQISWKFSTS